MKTNEKLNSPSATVAYIIRMDLVMNTFLFSLYHNIILAYLKLTKKLEYVFSEINRSHSNFE